MKRKQRLNRHTVRLAVPDEVWRELRRIASRDPGHDGRPRMGRVTGRIVEAALERGDAA